MKLIKIYIAYVNNSVNTCVYSFKDLVPSQYIDNT